MEDFLEEDKKATGNSFDVKQYLTKLIHNYLWIILSLILALAVAWAYLRYTVPKYSLSTYILIGGGELESSTNSILMNAGVTAENTPSALNNEIFILQSHHLIGEVVDSLKLNQAFTTAGNFKKQPVFQEKLPFRVTAKRKSPGTASPAYRLILKDQSFTIAGNEKSFTGKYSLPFVWNTDTIKIDRNQDMSIPGNEAEFGLQFLSRMGAIKKYISRLTVVPAKNGGAGLLQISVVDEVPERAEAFINVLIEKYNRSSQKFKNQAIQNALSFLGRRLTTVSAELDEEENKVRDFKVQNKVFDVSASATELLGRLQALDAQVGESNFQEQLLDLVESTVKNGNDQDLVVSANGLQDPVLSTQIAAYNEMVLKKQAVLSTGTESDLRLAAIDSQLAGMRKNILMNIGNIRRQFQKMESNYAGQESKYTGRFEALPEKEKQFIELSRKKGIKESLYLFLLQKREETEIQLVSSGIVKSRTVDDVLNDGIVSPSGKNIYGMAGLIGLLFPALLIFLRLFFTTTIQSKKEIENGTQVPILGELSLSPSTEPIVITTLNRSAIAEQIRAVRTNLSYIGGSEQHKVLVVTSSMGGEGKSFVSLNLANSMAIGNKKVAILELDLRKPMLSKTLGLANKKGITNFLIDEKMVPEDIIQPLKNYPNLHILSSGPIPPNPGELIISSRMASLIAYLRQHFDFVILDSPPVGLVSDSLSLGKLSDLSLFVIRHKYSPKLSLQLLNELYEGQKLPKLSVIINGIQHEKGGYGGSYGYGYGYYSDDDAKSKTATVAAYYRKFKKRLF